MFLAFQRWMLGQGYAVSSVNVRISTVKTYAKLAFKSGTLDDTTYALIKAVEGYSRKEIKRVDERRRDQDLDTRKGYKKVDPVSFSNDQAKELKNQPDTPQGRRDALLMSLLIDHGLRVGEVAALAVTDFDLKSGILKFYRPKVDRTDTHKLSGDTWRAAIAYFENDAPPIGCVWRGSRKGGKLTSYQMSERAIYNRVKTLGAEVGIEGLSPHDCRHYIATEKARDMNIHELMDMFGWSSANTAIGYIERSKVIRVE